MNEFTWRGILFRKIGSHWSSDYEWECHDLAYGQHRAWFSRADHCFQADAASRVAALDAVRELVIAHFKEELAELERMPPSAPPPSERTKKDTDG